MVRTGKIKGKESPSDQRGKLCTFRKAADIFSLYNRKKKKRN